MVDKSVKVYLTIIHKNATPKFLYANKVCKLKNKIASHLRNRKLRMIKLKKIVVHQQKLKIGPNRYFRMKETIVSIDFKQ